jgi:dGTPase
MDYLRILDKKITDAYKKTGSTSCSVLAEYCEGASPIEVEERIHELKLGQSKSAVENNNSAKLQNSYFFNLPAPNPEYFQWWYTLESQEQIASVIGENLDLESAKGLCLGTPTVAAYLHTTGAKVTLLDIDSDVIDVTQKEFKSELKARTYNAHSVLPKDLTRSFDYVVIDPPWYQPLFELFINKSIEAINGNGIIFCSIPKLLTRPSIVDERKKLTTAIINAGHQVKFIQKGSIKYIIPRFEELALERGLQSNSGVLRKANVELRPWRSSDLLAIEISGNNPIQLDAQDENIEIEDVQAFSRVATIKTFRLFVSKSAPFSHATETIEVNKGYAKTISKRENCGQFNLWTSDKTAYLVKDPEVACLILSCWVNGKNEESVIECLTTYFDNEAEPIEVARKTFAAYERKLKLWEHYSEGTFRRSDKVIRDKHNLLTEDALAQRSSAREHVNSTDGFRIEFQRDRDRIIWSSGFRKLSDKTQLFPLDEDDHLRQRLAHSIEVSQLASTIAASFGLDKDLVEAGALAHDIGHTPFGHAGEHALDILLSKHLKIDAGFNHYEHGVDIVRYLEAPYQNRGYSSHSGLDLTPEVCDCILKHSYCHHKTEDTQGIWDKSKHKAFINNPGYCHLEGQAVRAADKISYLLSDIEDGIKLGAVSYADLLSCRLFHRPPIDFRLEEGQSLYVKFIEQRGALIKLLMEDVILESSKRLSKVRNLDAVKKYSDYCIHHSPTIEQDMNEVWNKIQVRKLHADPRVRAANLKASKMVSDLTLLYIAIPDLIDESFRVEHARLLSLKSGQPYIRHYEKSSSDSSVGKKTVPVQSDIFRFLPLDRVIGEGLSVDLSIREQQIKVYDIILAKDFVASLTDKRAKRLYSELFIL